MHDVSTLFPFHIAATAVGKLLLACVLGGIIGIEREAKRKPVGIRTCIIIAVTTATLTIVSINAAEYYAAMSENIRTDPMRLAAQVVSGIGFLGTGVILHKTNDMISGITTAAMIWASAAMGIAVGAGFYAEAILVSLLILLTLKYSHHLKALVPHKTEFNHVVLKLDIDPVLDINTVSQTLSQRGCHTQSIGIKEKSVQTLSLIIHADIPENETSYDLYKALKQLDHLQSIDIKYFL